VTSFAERLAAAKAAPRPTRDVEVILDAGLGEKIDALADELIATRAEEAADDRLGQTFARTAAVQEKLEAAKAEARDSIVTLRFTRMPAAQWADVISRCPVRLESDIDKQYGFDADKAAVIGAPLCGVRLEGDDEVEVSDDEWRDLFATITGYEVACIADAIFALNFWGPAQRVSDLKKGFSGPLG
jgi:hypothetical protein